MSRILVTGATGFVGRRLCRALAERGDEVVAAVRSPEKVPLLPPRIECFTAGEIGPETRWHAGVLRSVDCVVHLAARVHMIDDPAPDPAAEFRRVNVGGTECLARAAARHVGRFVFVSSVHAMCQLSKDVLTEDSPCRPDSDYGKSKLAAEQIVRQVGHETGIETVVLRPPPVYGPGQLGNLKTLFDIVQKGTLLPLGRVAFNRRSLIYAENLVSALLACIDHPNAAGATFLVSDGEQVSIAELIRRIGAACGRRSRLLPVPATLLKLGGTLTGKRAAVERLLGSLAVDDSRIRDLLRWNAPYTMDEGLAATAETLAKAA